MPEAGDAPGVSKRQKAVRGRFGRRFAASANRFRDGLKKRYGEGAAQIKYAEAFEICEYGRQPNEAEIRRLFPFFPAK